MSQWKPSDELKYLIYLCFMKYSGLLLIVLSSVIFMVYGSSDHIRGIAVYVVYLYVAVLSMIYLYLLWNMCVTLFRIIENHFGGDKANRQTPTTEVTGYLYTLIWLVIVCPLVGHSLYEAFSFNVTLVVFAK